MAHVSCLILYMWAMDYVSSQMWQRFIVRFIIHYKLCIHLCMRNNSICWLLTFIFLLYFGLFTVIGSLISILRSVAPERRLKFDVIFCANDGFRLLIFSSFLHSFIITLESCSPWSLSVSSSFSAKKNSKIYDLSFLVLLSFILVSSLCLSVCLSRSQKSSSCSYS